MALPPEKQGGNAFLRGYRKVYSAFGFQKGYNFPLYIILAGALMGFVLSRFMELNIYGQLKPYSTSVGEWYDESRQPYTTAITIHLAAILPAGFLVCLQFTPVIRHKFLLYHRIAGYVIALLLLVGNAGAIMITPVAFGGTLAIQCAVGLLVIMTTGGFALAYYNIKRLQIDQHRAWMLRTWVYAGSIITLRLLNFMSTAIISISPQFHNVIECEFIANLSPKLVQKYPECVANPAGYAAVLASTKTGQPQEAVAALRLGFAMSAWLAIAIHAIGIEFYLHLTPVEGERLRQASYHKQMEAGMKNPGSAGLTADRVGDAPKWEPPRTKSTGSSESSGSETPRSDPMVERK